MWITLRVLFRTRIVGTFTLCVEGNRELLLGDCLEPGTECWKKQEDSLLRTSEGLGSCMRLWVMNPWRLRKSGILWGGEKLYQKFFLFFSKEKEKRNKKSHQESDQFRFLREACFNHLKGTVGLILVKDSTMRVSIPHGFSTWPYSFSSLFPSSYSFPSSISSTFYRSGTWWAFIFRFTGSFSASPAHFQIHRDK